MWFIVKKSSGKSKAVKTRKSGSKARPRALTESALRKKLSARGIKGELAEGIVKDALWAEKKRAGNGQRIINFRLKIERELKSKDLAAKEGAVLNLSRLVKQEYIPSENAFARMVDLYKNEPKLKKRVINSLEELRKWAKENGRNKLVTAVNIAFEKMTAHAKKLFKERDKGTA
jgi:hypothetical protein